MHVTKKTLLRFGFRTTISLLLIGTLVYTIGHKEIGLEIKTVGWQTLILVAAVLGSHVLIISPRWANILRAMGYPISPLVLVKSVFLGFFFNQILPTAVGGDVVRVWAAQQLGVPWSIAIQSVLLDRASGVAVVLLGTVVLLPLADPLAARDDLMWILPSAIVLLACAVVVVVLAGALPIAALRKLQRVFVELMRSLVDLSRRPWTLAIVGVFALIGQLLPVAAIALLAHALNIQIALIDIALVSFMAMLAATIPISVAGWGVREGALVYLFALNGVAPASALTLSILFGLCMALASAPGALLLLAPHSSNRVDHPTDRADY